MIEVETPDGAVIEFPDGTTPKQISDAMQRYTVRKDAREQVVHFGPFRRALYGAERSLDESAMGLKQLVVGLTDEEKKDLAVRREMEDQIPGTWVSRLGGDVAQWLAPGKAALSTAAKIPGLAGTTGRLAASGATGAAAGGLQPVLEGESRTKNATLGALFGIGGQAVGDTGGRIIEGVVRRSPLSRTLSQATQKTMTLGQQADRTSLAGRIASAGEERAQSIPVIGEILRKSRERGLESWRNDVVKSVAPDNFTVPKGKIREQMKSISDEFGRRYDAALANEIISPSKSFEQQVLKIINNPQSGVSQREARELGENILRNYQSRFAASGQPGQVSMTGEMAKDFESFLGKQANLFDRAAQTGNSPAAGNIAKLYSELEEAWAANYRNQMSPKTQQIIQGLDAKYAPYKTVERAAGARGTTDAGAFTPAQLDEAVSTRTGRSRYARGMGVLQKEAETGREVFSSRIPDSGTAERAMGGAALLGMITDPVSTATTLGAIPLMVTGAGKNLMTGESAAQILAKRLRLNKVARDTGLPLGVAVSDIIAEESERYSNAP